MPHPAEFRHDVELAREAGLDLLRVHGHISRPELYDAADELGMLLWQDFPLQWGYARSIRKEAVRQAREAVDQLGHHPSIAVWCAHNEPVAANLDRTARAGQGDAAVHRRPAAPVVEQDRARPMGQAGVRAGRRDAHHHRAQRRAPPPADCSTAPTATCTSVGITATSATCPASPHRCRAWCASSASSARRRYPARPTSWSPSAGLISIGSSSSSGMVCNSTPSRSTCRRPTIRRSTAGARPHRATKRRCCDITSRRCDA